MRVLKFQIVLFLILFHGIGTSQTKDSIIYLQEVIISTASSNEIVIKSKGSRDEQIGFYENEEIVSLISNIPAGKFSFVELFFDVKLYDTSKDLELELLVFDKDSTGLPGNLLLPKNVRFKVNGNKREKIVLDVSELDLSTKQDLFIGFGTVNLNSGVFLAEFTEKDKAVSYCKKSGSAWFVPVRKNPVQLRLNIGVLPM